jgi:hypothetical protein
MVFIQPSIVNSDRSLSDVQTDMDGRYTVSPEVRGFADGPDVLPGVNEIPHADKGKPADTRQTTPSAPAMKPSIRPAHRR